MVFEADNMKSIFISFSIQKCFNDFHSQRETYGRLKIPTASILSPSHTYASYTYTIYVCKKTILQFERFKGVV